MKKLFLIPAALTTLFCTNANAAEIKPFAGFSINYSEFDGDSEGMEIVEDKDEGGYVLSYPDLPGCMTCSDSLDDLLELAKDAKETWILGMLEDEKEIPLPSDLQSYSGQFKLRIPKSLHRSLSIHAKEEGISMNQYCLYLLAKNDAEYKKERR